ncbi:MAG: hypothetical protein VST68_05985, partial [Nitrospirota bacterium]|nr:hypothetical protein [Nitrospirota bacterium]
MSRLVRFWLFISFLAISTWVSGISPAVVDNDHKFRSLKGDFSLAMTRHCGETPFTSFWEGVLHYEKDGTGVFTGMRQRQVGPILQDEMTCPFPYTLNPDGSFTQSMNCTGTLVASTGPTAPIGGMHADTGIVLKGRTFKDSGSRGLVLGDTELNEE